MSLASFKPKLSNYLSTLMTFIFWAGSTDVSSISYISLTTSYCSTYSSSIYAVTIVDNKWLYFHTSFIHLFWYKYYIPVTLSSKLTILFYNTVLLFCIYRSFWSKRRYCSYLLFNDSITFAIALIFYLLPSGILENDYSTLSFRYKANALGTVQNNCRFNSKDFINIDISVLNLILNHTVLLIL